MTSGFAAVVRSRRTATVAVAALVVLVVAELAVRAIDRRLPEPLQWHNLETQVKVAQMDALAQRGGVDIAFVGSSIVRNAAEPDVVTQMLGSEVTAYNAGLTAGIPRLTELWTLHVVLPRLHPKLLVIGLNSFDLDANPASRNAFYDAFVAAPAARRALGRDDAVEDVDRWLGDHLALWGHREALRSPTEILDAVRDRAPTLPPEVAGLKANGRDAYLENQTFDQRNRSAGGLPVGDWALGTADRDALQRLVTGARAVGTEVVLVDMPVTDEFVAKHPHGEQDYASFRAALRAVARDTGARLVELDSMRDHAYFADEVHMNVTGAHAFTSALVANLAQESILPRVAG